MQKAVYSIDKYDFKRRLEKVFAVDDLTAINEKFDVFRRENDQSTNYHKIFYDWARTAEFTSLYDSFIAEVVQPMYNDKIVYQAIPTFRLALPGNVAVGEFHKDRNYRDEEWAKKVKEHNFFLPFTDAFDTNTVWVESEEDKGDFAPMNCKYGECIQWDGSNLTHGNKLNTTGKARVSVDFRVMLESNYVPNEHGSINTHTAFMKGAYYK
jgi:ectoine hydroxylase-related dioxygenase (phytanoyl-CoA dioxygenase family)